MTDKTTAHTLGGADPIKEEVERLSFDVGFIHPDPTGALCTVHADDLNTLLAAHAADREEIERLRGEIGDAISQLGTGWLATAEATLRKAIGQEVAQ